MLKILKWGPHFKAGRKLHITLIQAVFPVF